MTGVVQCGLSFRTSFWLLVIPVNVNLECQVSSPHTTQCLCTAVTAMAIATTATSSRTMTANKAVENDSS